MIPSLAAAADLARLPSRLDSLAEEQSRAAETLDRMDDEMEGDLDYQILRRTLNVDAAAARESPAAAKASGPRSGAPQREALPADAMSTQASASTSFRLEIETERITTISVEAQVSGPDGEFRLRLEAMHHERFSLRLEARQEVRQSDPLILDLDGDGVRTTGIDDGAVFDLTGDGRPEAVSFAAGGDAFLALDRNANGSIDSGRELFGDQHGAAHGFAELAKFDDNADGVIDAQDEVFARLRLFNLDENGSQRLRTLDEAGITAIHLDHENVRAGLGPYDEVAQRGRFERADGGTGEAADVLLGYRAVA